MDDLKIGQAVNGYCHGCFGRDSYGKRRVEAIGIDRVITRSEEGIAECYLGNPNELCGNEGEPRDFA